MLGSRYNDRKERLENRRSSFFLTASDPTLPDSSPVRRFRSTGNTTDNAAAAAAPITGLRRHTIAKTRSLDSGVGVGMSADPLQANNPQDDYGSTTRRGSFSTSSENETPLLVPAAGQRSKSMIGIGHRSSCSEMPNIDEKPVSFCCLSHCIGIYIFLFYSIFWNSRFACRAAFGRCR